MTLNVDPQAETDGKTGANNGLTLRPKTGDVAGSEHSLTKLFLILSAISAAGVFVLEKRRRHRME
ncbi:MAG: hypothetical protein J6Y58_06310 [Clostridiales bacterium]|nr:hypothetical protein [Clostridiales bacterium]